ncbi:helix-turn-helix domain-containing protein [Tomitella fengzijianii]|uniref:Helix-turn-helix domain-containing protein n=1 Tax=Tomitella fengzijianii TaxID=2597660 RepID=A0A516WZ56_9ACTN|nr:helix-turn-helix domain-containing protein [Tomitella fengzijianii]
MPHGPDRTTAPPAPPVSMIERVTLIVDAFHNAGESLTLGGIARRAGLPYSTTHRILESLIPLEWVSQTPLGYSLGRRGLRFRNSAADYSALRGPAAPHLHALHLRTGTPVFLTAMDGIDELVLDRIGGGRTATPGLEVGARGALHRTAGGRAMLSAIAPEDVDELVAVSPRGGLCGPPPSVPALHRELDRVRRRGGLSVERAATVPGFGAGAGRMSAASAIVGLAAPVFGPRGATAAVSLHARPTAPIREWCIPLLVQVARRISDELADSGRDARPAVPASA